MSDDAYSMIAVGTGFASVFFLHRYLEGAGPDARVLVLERGRAMSHGEQVAALPARPLDAGALFETGGAEPKPWRFSVGVGGGSNCWWACTPRMMPADFEMRSRHGVGEDWPVGYDDLERYYGEAEAIMAISGPERTPYPMSRPYPQGPHAPSNPDLALQAAYGDLYVAQPTARSRDGTPNRAACCGNGVCSLCPADAKFTIQNEMGHVLGDPRVTLLTGAEVLSVDVEAGVARGVVYRRDGAEHRAAGDAVALGANALFNPVILRRSGFDEAALGRYLHEQKGVAARISLDGMRNFTGSTVITGSGFMFYDGPHRAERAGCLVEGWNRGKLRLLKDRWTETLQVKLIFEDLPLAENHVAMPREGPDGAPGRPVAVTERRSDYMRAGLARATEMIEEIAGHLPTEGYEMHDVGSEAHCMGTARMGRDPATSVVDADLVHHGVRNLLVLGGSSFVTGAPANPTLTISALSLRAADRLLGADQRRGL